MSWLQQSFAGLRRGNLRLKVGYVRVPLGLGRRLVVASDLHADVHWMPAAAVRQAVAAINAIQGVDAVLMPGDFVANDASAIRWAAPELAAIRAPVYATLGNHDHWTDPQLIRDALLDAGVKVLSDEVVELRGGGLLAGVESLYAGGGDCSFMAQELADRDDLIVIAHEPAAALGHAAPLQLSGHTHHGQVRLPVITRAVVMPRYSEPYPVGLYRRAERSWVYTTSGVGYTTVPVRLFAPAEIAVVDV